MNQLHICILLLLVCFVTYSRTLLLDDQSIINQNLDNQEFLGDQLTETGKSIRIDRDIFKHPLDIIRAMGFQPEVHEIETEDRYILTAWRIWNLNQPSKKFPILLQHGLLDLSFSWFINRKRELCLPSILADLGYDVWVLNNRGNRLSRNAQKEVKNYWEFSFQEMARYDLPANVKYIKQLTGKKKVYYIGHSQGSQQFLAKTIETPEFQANIAAFIGLGPVFFIHNQQSKIIQEIKNFNIPEILDRLHLHNFLRPKGDFNPLLGLLCMRQNEIYVKNFLKQLCGPFTGDDWDHKAIPILCSHEPGGTSVRNIEHWMQNYRNKGFYYYDYKNPIENWKHYNQTVPPSYPLQNFKIYSTPTYFIRGETDYLSSQEDLDHLYELMPDNYSEIIKQDIIKGYSHLEVIWAQNAYNKVFKLIIDYLETH